uniref:hypothetical protein n=1 Tax=Mycobacterium avium TaxID=1764 RepID=UPI001F1B9CC3
GMELAFNPARHHWIPRVTGDLIEIADDAIKHSASDDRFLRTQPLHPWPPAAQKPETTWGPMIAA